MHAEEHWGADPPWWCGCLAFAAGLAALAAGAAFGVWLWPC